MTGLYVRYFIEYMAWYVCRNEGHLRNLVTGPWDTEAVAQLSLEVQS